MHHLNVCLGIRVKQLSVKFQISEKFLTSNIQNLFITFVKEIIWIGIITQYSQGQGSVIHRSEESPITYSFFSNDCYNLIHTYKHNWPSVRIMTQLLTPFKLCALISYVSGGTYSLTSTPNDRFFKHFFLAGLFTLRVSTRSQMRGNLPQNMY